MESKIYSVKSRKKKKKDTPDYISSVVVVQAIVCALVCAAAFLCARAGGNVHEQLKQEITYIMGTDITVEKAVSVFKNAVGFVADPSSAWEPDDKTNGSTDEIDEATVYGASGGVDLYTAPTDASFSPVFLTKKGIFPLKTGTVTSRFGYRIHPIYGKVGFHTGLDLAADEGSDIYCIFDGVVKSVGCDNSRGNYITVEHTGGIETRYFHCSGVIAKEGAVIRKGEVIAKVGSTGISTGPHLHIETLLNGVRYNPIYFIDSV